MHKWSYWKKYEKYELDFGIKLKLKVYSLQRYQKLIFPKMSLVPWFVGVHHIPLVVILRIYVIEFLAFYPCLIQWYINIVY